MGPEQLTRTIYIGDEHFRRHLHVSTFELFETLQVDDASMLMVYDTYADLYFYNEEVITKDGKPRFVLSQS